MTLFSPCPIFPWLLNWLHSKHLLLSSSSSAQNIQIATNSSPWDLLSLKFVPCLQSPTILLDKASMTFSSDSLSPCPDCLSPPIFYNIAKGAVLKHRLTMSPNWVKLFSGSQLPLNFIFWDFINKILHNWVPNYFLVLALLPPHIYPLPYPSHCSNTKVSPLQDSAYAILSSYTTLLPSTSLTGPTPSQPSDSSM